MALQRLTVGPHLCKNCKSYLNFPLRTPFVVRCGHSICESCLNNTTTFYEDVLCSHCRNSYLPSDSENYFNNISLKKFIDKSNEAFGTEVWIDEHKKKLRHILLKKCNDTRFCLKLWEKQILRGMSMQMNFSFWIDELNRYQKNLKKSMSPGLLAHSLKEVSDILVRLEPMREDYNVEFNRILNEHLETSENPKLSWWAADVALLEMMHKLPGDAYVTNFINDEQYYYKISGDKIHLFLHSGIVANEENKKDLQEKVIDLQWNLQTIKTVFMDLCFSAGETKRSRRIFIGLQDPMTDFQVRILSIFMGEYGKTFKGLRSIVHRGGIRFQESLVTPSILNVPVSKTTGIQLECELSDLVRPTVAGYTESAYNGSLIILTNDLPVNYEPKPMYFGKVESGIDFLAKMSSYECLVEDCGIVKAIQRRSFNSVF